MAMTVDLGSEPGNVLTSAIGDLIVPESASISKSKTSDG